MKRFSRWVGKASLVLIVLGLLGYGIAPMFPGFYVIPWTLAGAGLLFFIFFNPEVLVSWGRNRSVRYGAGSAASTALVLGILVIVSVLSVRHHHIWDMTADRRYSLAPQTIQILQGLDQEVTVSGYFQIPGPDETEARTLFEQYAQVTPKFKYEVLDPERNPVRARAAGIDRYGTVVVASGDQSEKINGLGEDKLSNALLRVTKPGRKIIYTLIGHGERDLDNKEAAGYSQFKVQLEGQNYEVRPLLLMQTEGVPEDAAEVIVADPHKELLPAELELLDKYLRGGGKALFLLEPQTVPELAAWLANFGVVVGNNIIVDQFSSVYGQGPLTALVAVYSPHPVTRDLKNRICFMTLARSVTVSDKLPEGVNDIVLAETTNQAWAETDFTELSAGKARFNDGQDMPGPVPVAVLGTVKSSAPEGQMPEAEGKFIVFGDADFVTNKDLLTGNNVDLILNAVSWLAEESDLVAIRPKAGLIQPLLMTAMQARLLFWGTVVVLPLAILCFGALVVVKRRVKR